MWKLVVVVMCAAGCRSANAGDPDRIKQLEERVRALERERTEFQWEFAGFVNAAKEAGIVTLHGDKLDRYKAAGKWWCDLYQCSRTVEECRRAPRTVVECKTTRIAWCFDNPDRRSSAPTPGVDFCYASIERCDAAAAVIRSVFKGRAIACTGVE